MTPDSELRLADGPLKRALSYPKLARRFPTALVLDGNYHLGRECIAALTRLGCPTAVLPVDIRGRASELVRALLFALVERRPDFVLSINHIGFDDGGQIGGILDEVSMPVAVWYVDSPIFNLSRACIPAPRMTTLFVWERTLVPTMRERGYDDVHYLPLGTDPDKFLHQEQPASRPLGFVGDSMEHARGSWGKRLGRRGRSQADRLAARLLAGERLDRLMAERTDLERGAEDSEADIWALATYSATAAYRLGLLRKVASRDLHLNGDPGWRRVLPGCTYHGPVNYGPDLAEVYRSTAITLNATSLQMPTAVNQRVFDVPAAGGFLLTDDQEDLQLHFEPGSEAVVYHDPAELVDLARYYATREAERRAISRRAYARVQGEHTYVRRIETLLTALRARHG